MSKEWSSVSVFGFGDCTRATEQTLLWFIGLLCFLQPLALAVPCLQRVVCVVVVYSHIFFFLFLVPVLFCVENDLV